MINHMVKKDTKENIIVLSAHSDDFVLGAGGTIANYAREGKRVHAIIFSYGEKSHPWMKKHLVKRMREREAREAGRILGCKVHFFDLEEFMFLETYKEKGADKELAAILARLRPAKIFTHSQEDIHLSPGLLTGKDDHKAVHAITLEAVDSVLSSLPAYAPEIYVYSIWNPVSMQSQFPALYVDISSTFRLKRQALKAFPSQRWNAIYPLMLLVFKRALLSGWRIRKRFAESFYRIR